MIATPKSKMLAVGDCYQGHYGMRIETKLTPGQKWTAKRLHGRYWQLTRKGSATQLRLTEAAMQRLFDLKEET